MCPVAPGGVLSAVAASCVRGLYCLPVSAALRHCLGEVVCFPLWLASPAVGWDQSGVRKASAAGGNSLNFEDMSTPLARRSCDAAADPRLPPPQDVGSADGPAEPLGSVKKHPEAVRWSALSHTGISCFPMMLCKHKTTR